MAPTLRLNFLIAEQAWQKTDVAWLENKLQEIFPNLIKLAAPQLYALKSCSLEILLTNNNEMQQLKKEFLAKDEATNVLAFPFDLKVLDTLPPETIDPIKAFHDFLGSIALGLEVIIAEAVTTKKAFRHHLLHLTIHAILHLLGYRHEKTDDAKKMEQLERELLENIGIANPYKNL